MMSNEQQKYAIPRYLDEPKRLMLWTVDEVTAFLLPLSLIYWLSDSLLVGIAIGFISFFGLKKLKGDQNQSFLRALLYWYLPPIIRFRKTPPSFIREYIG